MYEFWYDVVTSEKLMLDFDKIYNRVVEELKKSCSEIDIHMINNEFLDNQMYYLQELYDCKDLCEEDNEYVLDTLGCDWEEWLDDKFGHIDWEMNVTV